jgi:hypothetical protein
MRFKFQIYVTESLRGKWKDTLHGFEIPYTFSIPAAHVGDKVTGADKAMGRLASAYWIAFGQDPDKEQGFGAAGIMSMNMALVRFTYPHRILGRGIGINALVVAVSAAIGPTLAAGHPGDGDLAVSVCDQHSVRHRGGGDRNAGFTPYPAQPPCLRLAMEPTNCALINTRTVRIAQLSWGNRKT